MAAQPTKTPVIIVGGGIVGLSASLFLSAQNISHILVERRSGTSIHPRSRSVNVRTMELYRSLGIDEAVRKAGAVLGPSMGIYKGPSLFSVISPHKRAKTLENNHGATGQFSFLESASPTFGARGTQDLIEPVLLEAARERGGDVRFDTECMEFEQDDSGVTITLRDRKSSNESRVHASYLIAADGAGSPIRQKLGVQSTGKGTLGHLLNILFHADLSDFVRGREFSLCMIERPEVRGLFTSINNSDRWVFHLSYDPSKGEKPEEFPPERCEGLLRIALGIPDVAIDVKSILPWQPSERVAEGLQHGRVFLAGDAAHTMTPYGGQGANSGIADVHNLAWKMAAVLNGVAGSKLLETYDVERLPVGRRAASMSAAMADERGLLLVKGKFAMLASVIGRLPMLVGFGYSYASQAIIPETLSSRGWFWWWSVPWTVPSLLLGLDGSPGTRAPHVWVEHEGKQISTLDLVGPGFVLIVGSKGKVWCKSAPHVASRLGVDLKVFTAGPTADLIDTKRLWEHATGISPEGAVLIRPDGFIAWRMHGQPVSEEGTLDEALGKVLCI